MSAHCFCGAGGHFLDEEESVEVCSWATWTELSLTVDQSCVVETTLWLLVGCSSLTDLKVAHCAMLLFG